MRASGGCLEIAADIIGVADNRKFCVPALHCVQLSSAWLPDPTPGL